MRPSPFRRFVNCSILKRQGLTLHRTLPMLHHKAFPYRTPEQSQLAVQQRPAEPPVPTCYFTWGYTGLHRSFQIDSWITNHSQTRKMHHIWRLQANRRLNGMLRGLPPCQPSTARTRKSTKRIALDNRKLINAWARHRRNPPSPLPPYKAELVSEKAGSSS